MSILHCPLKDYRMNSGAYIRLEIDKKMRNHFSVQEKKSKTQNTELVFYFCKTQTLIHLHLNL